MVLPDGKYRRKDPPTVLTTETRRRQQYARAARAGSSGLEFDPSEFLPLPPSAEVSAAGFPFPQEESMQVLGVLLDRFLVPDAQ